MSGDQRARSLERERVPSRLVEEDTMPRYIVQRNLGTVSVRQRNWSVSGSPRSRRDTSRSGLRAGLRDALERVHLHLTVDERARDADALTDVIRQFHPVRGVDDIDLARALFQEA